MTALPIETLQERIAQSELGKTWILEPLLKTWTNLYIGKIIQYKVNGVTFSQ